MNDQPVKTYRKLSIVRVIFAILLLGALIDFAFFRFTTIKATKNETIYTPWFASYVDVTSTPTYTFEQLGATPTSDVVLSFIVSSTTEACTPTWGSFYTLDQAANAL